MNIRCLKECHNELLVSLNESHHDYINHCHSCLLLLYGQQLTIDKSSYGISLMDVIAASEVNYIVIIVDICDCHILLIKGGLSYHCISNSVEEKTWVETILAQRIYIEENMLNVLVRKSHKKERGPCCDADQITPCGLEE